MISSIICTSILYTYNIINAQRRMDVLQTTAIAAASLQTGNYDIAHLVMLLEDFLFLFK